MHDARRIRHRLPPICLGFWIAAALSTPARAQPADPPRSAAVEAVETALGAAPDTTYRIHAFHIGTSASARRDLFIADPSLPKRIPVAFAFWLIEGHGRRILVDTGFVNKAMIEKWNISDHRSPKAALGEAGLAPGDITDVVITHAHWDHIGGLGLFGHARLWLPRPVARGLRQRPGFDRIVRQAEQAGRLEILKDIRSVAPGVVAVSVGLHAPGCQYIVVETGQERWVLASDLAPLYANFERNRSTGQTTDPGRTLQVQSDMRQLAGGALSRILPGHEPSIFAGGRRHVVVAGKDRQGVDSGSLSPK